MRIKLPSLVAALVVVVGMALMTAPAAQAANYCGPSVDSISGLIGYYKSPAGQPMAKAVEKYVRADSKYYGIQADQSFETWLTTLKARKAPRRGKGSKINKNTYCPGGNTVANYNGKYDVGGLLMLDICKTKTKTTKSKVKTGAKKGYWKIVRTTTTTCKHAFKGYCRNVVKSVTFKKVTRKVSYKKITKGCDCPPPPPSCETKGLVTVAGNCVTQTQSARMDCEAKGNGWTWNGAQCVQIQVVCGVVVIGSGTATTGDICSTTVPPPPPPPPEDQPPSGEIDAAALHMQTGGRTVKLYFIGDDPDGDDVVLDILLSAPAGTYVSGKTRVTAFSDPLRVCPSDKTCWEATLVSDNTPGDALIRGKFTAGGKSFTTEPVTVRVEPDQFPT